MRRAALLAEEVSRTCSQLRLVAHNESRQLTFPRPVPRRLLQRTVTFEPCRVYHLSTCVTQIEFGNKSV